MHQYFQEAEILYQRAIEMLKSKIENLGKKDEGRQRKKLEGTLGGVMTHRAFFLQRMGRNPEALAQHLASIDLLEPLDEPYFLAFAFIICGTLSWSVGDIQNAMIYLQRGLSLEDKLGLAWLRAIGLCFLGATLHDQGKYAEAYDTFGEALKTKDPYLRLLISTVFNRTAQIQGRMNEVQELLRENLQAAQESPQSLGDRVGIGANGIHCTGRRRRCQGTPDAARKCRSIPRGR